MLPREAVLSNWQLAKIFMFGFKAIIFQVIRSQIISDIKCQKFCLIKQTVYCGAGGYEQIDLLSSVYKCSCAAQEKRNRQDGGNTMIKTNYSKGNDIHAG